MEDVADHLVTHNGSLDHANLGKLVDLYVLNQFIGEHLWGDWPPILVAGVFILDPEFVVQRIKAGTWQNAESFLRGDEDAGEFFVLYTGDGPGAEILKNKYEANKQLCHTKYNELKQWIVIQKDQAGQ